MIRTILSLLLALPALGATRYVATNGTNSGSAESWGAAWRTIAYAAANASNGDTILVGAGDFNEYVYLSARSNLTFQAVSNATSRAFRVGTASNTFSGLRLLGAQNEGVTWGAFFRLELAANYTTITNCVIGDTPQATATNFVFDPDTQTITSPDVDFVSAGFRTNGVIYWGGNSLTNGWYANMCESGPIAGVESNTLYLAAGSLPNAETNSSAWSYIYAGPNYVGIVGVDFVAVSQNAASNCRIVDNLFTNLVSVPIRLNGYNNTIAGNEITRQIGNSGITLRGANHVIVSNYFHDCLLPIYYSAHEFNTQIYHPPGGGFYDFIQGFIHDTGSYTTAGNSNNLVAWNWFENIEQPIGQFSIANPAGNYSGLTITSNVFIGFTKSMSGGWNDFNVSHNTFYQCAFDEGTRYTLTLGSAGITNVSLTNNLFLDCGDHAYLGSEGGWTLVNAYGTVNTNGNAIVGPEIAGNFTPVRDISNPRGPDGIPFTADDGLRPLAGSALDGKGALAAWVGAAVHFWPVSNPGWHEATGSNYNPAWQQLSAPLRPSLMRPYTNPPTLGALPFTARFEATNSISYTWSSNRWVGIRDFTWDFGDGARPVWTRWPDVSRTYLLTGNVAMTLTVTNSAGGTASTTRNYRIAPVSTFTNSIHHVSTAGDDATGDGSRANPYRTITNCLSKAYGGDYVAVLSSDRTSYIDGQEWAGRAGTAAQPITVVGYDTFLDSVYQRYSWWTWEGFMWRGTNIKSGLYAVFQTAPPVHGITLRNNWFNGGKTDTAAVFFAAISGHGGTNYTVSNNLFSGNSGGAYGVFTIRGVTNATVDANIMVDTIRQGDFMQILSWNVVISRNYCYNLGGNNHPDFFQIPGNTNDSAGNIVVERNWAEIPADSDAQVQVGQMSTFVFGSASYTNIIFRNNVFIGFKNGLNMRCDGNEMFNNLFYRSGTSGSTVINSGGAYGSTYEQDIRNNVFYECGLNSVSSGWYQNGLWSHQTNATITTADYNFVSGPTNAAKQVAPPENEYRWAVAGQEANGVNGGDPNFTDAASGDFSLAAGSVLLGAGTDLSATGFSTDFWGFPRGETWSIGPFEAGMFEAGVPPPSQSRRIRANTLNVGSIVSPP